MFLVIPFVILVCIISNNYARKGSTGYKLKLNKIGLILFVIRNALNSQIVKSFPNVFADTHDVSGWQVDYRVCVL